MTFFPLPRARQLVRLFIPRIFILFGLLLFVARTPPMGMEERYSYAGLSLPVFIALLFLITMGHLWWLRSGRQLELLTKVQCAMDPWLVVILVILTGSFQSPFLFLNGLVTLNAALLLGRREALLTAGMILIFSAATLSLTTMLLGMPLEPAPVLLRGFLIHGIAYFLTALLGGALAQRAETLQQAYDRQTDSLADLTALQEQIVNAIPYGLITVNNQGIIRTINPGVRALLGLDSPVLLGRALQSVYPEFYWVVERAKGEAVYVEMTLEDHIWGLNVSFLVNRRQEQIGALLVIRDLTPIKRLEQEVMDGERLALIGRMAAGMAHEIRNPLASILSAAQMLTYQDAREERLLTIIREEVARLKQLTGDFLQFSRPAKSKRQRVELTIFLAEMAEQVKEDPRWGNRELLMKIPKDKIWIWFDAGQLRQIYWNLFLNAMQADLEGGPVRVKVKPVGKRVIMTVADDGPGVDAELLPKLIEPFFTTRVGGSGLGLAVVQQLVLLNGGRLQLKNGVPRGLLVIIDVEGADG